MTLSVAYLKTLGVCWTDEQLHEAAKQWPNASPTWAWFLGVRLEAFDVDGIVLRLQVAAHHAHIRRIKLPLKPGAVVAAAKAAEPEARLHIASAFGHYLDALEEGNESAQQAYRALTTALALEL
jgi:hypothetical protein